MHVVGGVLLSFCFSVYSWVLPTLLSRFGVCFTGVVYSIVNFVSIFFLAIFGVFTDFVGRKPALIVSNFISVIIFALLALWWNNPVALTSVLFLEVVDISFYYSAARSLIAESVKKAGLEQFLGTAFSISATFAMFASAAGSFVGGYLIDVLGYSKVFVIFLILATTSLILRFFYEETLEKRVSSISFENPFAIFKQFGRLRGVRGLPYLIAYVSIIGLISSIANVYIWIFMEKILGMSASFIGLSFGIMECVSALVQPFAGRFVDRFGPVAGMAMMCIIAAPAVVAFANAPNPWFAILFITISSSASTFYYAGYSALVTRVTMEDVRATTFGILSSITKIASIPGPILGAVLWKINPKLVFYTIAILYITATTITTILNKKQVIK